MPIEGEYEPSPWDFVAEHVRQYEETGGREGGTLEGKPCVILTTRGRRTGKLRKSALMRVEHDGAYALVASFGGAPKHPVWFWNLKAHPDEVLIQDGPEPYRASVREVDGTERDEWWARAVAVYPEYAEYQQRTERMIPVLIASPV